MYWFYVHICYTMYYLHPIQRVYDPYNVLDAIPYLEYNVVTLYTYNALVAFPY